MALPAWGQQYQLYVPQPVASDQKAASQDGILVQEVEVQKGDTLYGLSRKFNGLGMYFPQILLFNSIKNPNLIYPGSNLKVPVKTETQPATRHLSGSSPVSSPNTEISLSDLKTVGSGKHRASRTQKKSAVHAKKSQPLNSPALTQHSSPLSAVHHGSAATAPAVDSAARQKLFEAAVKAYSLDDCRTALDLFERYLASNASSPLAADATLYKAECYLKLSAQ
jgi:LysM repeat protein